jgi:hypothetical protein
MDPKDIARDSSGTRCVANLVQKSEDILIATRKLTSCYNINILWRKCMLLSQTFCLL